MTPAELISAKGLWARATDAADDARLLFEAGRSAGACSRAYYAMYSAVRAVLIGVDRSAAMAKRHETVLRAFSDHFVRTGRFQAEASGDLRRAMSFRQRADYDQLHVTLADGRGILAAMDRLLAAAGEIIGSEGLA